jgi:UDP:flavonoid glycosyltransferase YjiC (YdhE family)
MKTPTSPPRPVRVLLAPFPLPGHLSPFLALAHELARRGHVPTIVAEPSAQATIQAARGAFAPAATRDAWTEAETYCHVDDVVGWAGRVARDTAPHIARLIDAVNPDVLVVDEMHLGAALAAEASGRPWLSLPTSPVLRHPAFMDWPSMVPVRALLEQAGLPASDDRNSLERGRSRWGAILPWTREFDLGAVRPTELHAGPLVWDGAAAGPPPGPPPAILVSLSTSPQLGLSALLENFLREVTTALARLPHASLVTAPAVPGVAHLPAAPHVRVVPFADHGPLMASLRLFIHHGGWGSVGRCLLHGVPMIICPFERDQPTNAHLCQELGLAVTIEPAQVAADELRPRIEELVGEDAPHRRVAAAHAAALAGAPPVERATDRVLEL